jgi:pimeloyl-ACP methyl ester carboxylesterase
VEFFSGFGFKNEKALFKEILERGEFVVAGFSYGAQQALEYTLQKLQRSERVQKLQLISPAYFNELPKAIKLKEIQNFAKNPKLYMRFFYKKAAYPYKGDLKLFQREPELSELKALLFYDWEKEKLRRVVSSGVEIEVYIGEMDKIVDPVKTKKFFQEFGTVYCIKEVGHILRRDDG